MRCVMCISSQDIFLTSSMYTIPTTSREPGFKMNLRSFPSLVCTYIPSSKRIYFQQPFRFHLLDLNFRRFKVNGCFLDMPDLKAAPKKGELDLLYQQQQQQQRSPLFWYAKECAVLNGQSLAFNFCHQGAGGKRR